MATGDVDRWRAVLAYLEWQVRQVKARIARLEAEGGPDAPGSTGTAPSPSEPGRAPVRPPQRPSPVPGGRALDPPPVNRYDKPWQGPWIVQQLHRAPTYRGVTQVVHRGDCWDMGKPIEQRRVSAPEALELLTGPQVSGCDVCLSAEWLAEDS